jgi:hypothetical protein
MLVHSSTVEPSKVRAFNNLTGIQCSDRSLKSPLQSNNCKLCIIFDKILNYPMEIT